MDTSSSANHGHPFTLSQLGGIPGLAEGEAARLAVVLLRPQVRAGLSPRVLRRVREYVETHLGSSITLQAMASTAGLSLSHFARAFKQAEGLAPHEYLVRCRVRRALELLSNTDMPLAQIACTVGFADQSHFARRFREHVGITPSRYRWSMR